MCVLKISGSISNPKKKAFDWPRASQLKRNAGEKEVNFVHYVIFFLKVWLVDDLINWRRWDEMNECLIGCGLFEPWPYLIKHFVNNF